MDDMGRETARDIFGNSSPECTASGITLRTPQRFGHCWYWLIAGKQFCCSFRGPKDCRESKRALEALVAYVRDRLPEPVAEPGKTVGPCCVPEGGDFPKPLPAESDD